MGTVIESPFRQEKLNNELLKLISIPRDFWFGLGAAFAASADIFDGPMYAAKAIVATAERKKGLVNNID